MMNTTSPSLLQRLREPNQPASWARFVELYTPLLLTWARRMGLQSNDAADLVQDVFAKLIKELPKFQYDLAKRNFRGWLRTICFNQWRDRQRRRSAQSPQAKEAELAQLEASDDGLEQFWKQEHDAYLVRQALATFQELQNEFEPKTFQACWAVVVQQRPVAEIAQQLGLTENAVYIAKLRVLRRLRQELDDFLS